MFLYFKYEIVETKEYKVNLNGFRDKYQKITYKIVPDDRATKMAHEANNMHYLDALLVKKAIAKKYEVSFENQNFIKGQSGFVDGHAYHLYVIEVENRLGLYNYLREHKIFAQIHYIPCHLMPYYKELGWKEGDFPMVELYYKNCISLPMYPTLTNDEQEFVIQTIKNYYA